MPSDVMMPLRQTCDRCRELKVRCKRGTAQAPSADGNTAALSRPCARCSRVGVMCKYSRKTLLYIKALVAKSSNTTKARHRSGRHAQQGVQDETEKHTSNDFYLPSTSYSLSANQTHDIDWSWTYELATLDCPQEMVAGNTALGCPQALDMAYTVPAENMRDLVGERAKAPDLFADRKERSKASDTTITVAPTNEHWNHHDRKATEASTHDVFDLNARTARMLQSMTSEPTSDMECPSNDEMIDVASCLLKIIERLCQQIHRVQSPPDGSSPLTQVSVNSRDSGTGQRSVAQSLDLSTAMLTLACHQRIVELFGYVCSSISSKVHNDHPLPALSQKPTGATALSPEVGTMSNAQRFMTLELLTYLLHKLDRGQAQLANALRPNSSAGSVCVSMSSAESYATGASASPSAATYCGPNESLLLTGQESLSINTAGHLIVDRAMDAQRGLFTQIRMTKQMVTRIDGI
ncbi:hypothetical protein F5Y09DRAFT_20190 [Xylaria sp. FL1042]|nr:hypothetical protein F5Y09DRAFT_20190 [Xylaria sp. FL1042]